MNRRKNQAPQRISKSKNRRVEYRKILIATEGTNTEPQYFEGLSAHLNAKAVRVLNVKTVGVGADPLRIVAEAERRRDRELKSGDGYDEVWCVLDVDRHANLQSACTRARKSDIDVAISSPCFEIWLLWHYEECTGWREGKALLQRLKDKCGFTDKNLPAMFPYSSFPDAVARAERCEVPRDEHAPPNPYSSVFRLVKKMQA
ncbi:RloB family protein [Streptomyces sp. NBC_00390]|uniref:RloB family protein n=1 Tax=Streptomyces sp. NBC_00390 TaxID=2975736 RepID=UPI003FCD7D7A